MTAIYHITHVDNLPRIVADGGLRCVADLRQAGQPASYLNVAHKPVVTVGAFSAMSLRAGAKSNPLDLLPVKRHEYLSLDVVCRVSFRYAICG
jgi:hypothetical protein